MAVDGSIVFNTKIDSNGFEKGTKQISSRILNLKNKISATEIEANKLTSELNALAKKEIKSKTVEGLEKSVESAKVKLSELEGKAEEIFQNTRSSLFDMGFDDSNLDSVLEQNKEWVNLQGEIAKVDEELQRYISQLNSTKEIERSILGIDTDEYKEKKEKLFQLTQKLNVYKTQLKEAEKKERSFSDETADSSETLKKFVMVVKELGKKLSSTFKGIAIKSIKNFTGYIKNLSKGTSKVNNQVNGLAKSLNRIKQAISGMLLYKVIQGGIEAFKESLKEIVKVSPNINKQLSVLLTSFTYMKNTLAAAFLPLLITVTPILENLMDIFSKVINKIAEFFSALTGQSTYVKAVKVQQDYAKSIDDTTKSTKANTKAVKDNQKNLSGYDELNVMQDNSNNSDVSSPLYKMVAVPFNKFANELKKSFSKGNYNEIAKTIARKINSALSKIGWIEIISTARKIAKNIVNLLNGFIVNLDWKLIGRTIANGIRVALDFMYVLISDFDWSKLGKSIGDVINGALSKYNASLFAKALSNLLSGIFSLLTNLVRTINWEKVSSTIIEFISNIKWGNISRVVVGFINSLSKAITTFNFRNIGKAFQKGLSKIKWKDLWNNVTELFTKVLKGVADLFGLKGISVSPLKNALKNLYNPISNIFKTLKQTIGTLIVPIINNFLPAMVTVVKSIMKAITPVIKSVTPVLKTIITVASSAMNSLSPVISSIGKVVAKIVQVLSPFLKPIAQLISGVANILGPAISTIFDFTSGLLKPLSGAASLLGDIILEFTSPFKGETITQKMQEEIDGLQTTSEDLKILIDDTKTAIEETEASFSSVIDETTEIDTLKNQLQELVEKANLTPEEQLKMKTVAELLAEKVPGFKKTWDKLTKTDEKGKIKFTQSKEEMVASIDDVINKYKEQYMTEALRDQYKKLYEQQIEQNKKVASAQQNVNKAQKEYNTAVTKALTAEENMKKAMGNGSEYDKAVKKYNTACTSMNNLGDALYAAEKEFLKAKGSQSKLKAEMSSLSASVDVVSGKFKKSKNNLQAIRDTFERGFIDEDTLKKQFGMTAKELYSQTKSMGKYINEGYKSGLNAGAKELYNSSTKYARGMISEMKKELDIHSPSKKTEELGRYLAEGLVDKNGLNDSSILENGFKLFRKNLSVELKRIKNTIRDNLTNIPSYFANAFSKIWDKIKPHLNTMLDGFQSFFNYLVRGLNEVISDLNYLGKITKKSYVKMPNLPNITLPRYATGQVVPANYGEFAAILGDNKREPEVVSPLSTIKQAVKEAFAEGGFTTGNGEINLTINLDGEAVYKSVVKHDKANVKRCGTSAFAY